MIDVSNVEHIINMLFLTCRAVNELDNVYFYDRTHAPLESKSQLHAYQLRFKAHIVL